MFFSSFSGIIPLLELLNSEVYTLCSSFPPYFSKIIIGILYGIFLGLVYAFWKREIFFIAVVLCVSFSFLQWMECIFIDLTRVYNIIGISESMLSTGYLLFFLKTYYIELLFCILVTIFLDRLLRKD